MGVAIAPQTTRRPEIFNKSGYVIIVILIVKLLVVIIKVTPKNDSCDKYAEKEEINSSHSPTTPSIS